MKISVLDILVCTLLCTLVACSTPPTQESEQISVLQNAQPIETEIKAPEKTETTTPSFDLTEKETVSPETDSSFVQESKKETVTEKEVATEKKAETEKETVTKAETATEKEAVTEKEEMVWVTSSGKKYHSDPSCSNMKSPFQVPLKEAQKTRGPCSKCY